VNYDPDTDEDDTEIVHDEFVSIKESTSTIKISHSQSSLLTYVETTDKFDEEFERHKEQSDRPEEPCPPRRPSDMYDDDELLYTPQGTDDDDEEEETIRDKESSINLNIVENRQTQEEITPRSSAESIDDENLPMTYATTLPTELPPSPVGECDIELERKFEHYFEMKSKGTNFNENIKRRRDYKNPAIYEYLVQTYGIDEKGSNLDRTIYDPHEFNARDYYGALGEYQAARVQEASKKRHIPENKTTVIGNLDQSKKATYSQTKKITLSVASLDVKRKRH